MPTYWISFMDQSRPVGQKSVVAIIEAEDADKALASASAQGLHPGGDATIDDITHRAPEAEWYNRLLDSKQARDVNRLMCIASQDRHEEDEDEA